MADAMEGDLQGADEAQDVGYVVVAQMRDPEDLALELALAARHLTPELRLENLRDLPRFHPGRGLEGGEGIAMVDRGEERQAKRLRRESGLAAGEVIKTIFAENELQAEELLNEPRGEEPMTGEDY